MSENTVDHYHADTEEIKLPLLKVVAQKQDFSDPDGFPNIFFLSDGTLVLSSEKRGIHVKQNKEILERTYKRRFDNLHVNRAIDQIDSSVQVEDFNAVDRLLYNLILGD